VGLQNCTKLTHRNRHLIGPMRHCIEPKTAARIRVSPPGRLSVNFPIVNRYLTYFIGFTHGFLACAAAKLLPQTQLVTYQEPDIAIRNGLGAATDGALQHHGVHPEFYVTSGNDRN
jgi:hypothetical protein